MINSLSGSLSQEERFQHPRLSVQVYHKMGEAGIFEPDLRVELIEGELIDMAPIGSRHAAFVSRFSELLTVALHGKVIEGLVDQARPVEIAGHDLCWDTGPATPAASMHG